MLGPHRRPVEHEHAAPLKDAVQDGLSEVFVVEHAPPDRRRLVGREDLHITDRSPLFEDEDARLEMGGDRLREAPARKAAERPSDEFRRR